MMRLKEGFNEHVLTEHGYSYNAIEGGYVSKDAATIVSIDRRPYERTVMQFTQNDAGHENNIKQLREIGAIDGTN